MSNSNQELSGWERFQKFVSESASIKLIVIGFIILLLLIPLALVQDLMRERSDRQFEAINEVSQTWGQEQTVTGPFITLPYYKRVRLVNGDHGADIDKSYFQFLPEKLDVNAEVATETRSRGIYDVVVYTTKVTLTGSFKNSDISLINDLDTVLLNEAIVSLGISDLHNLGDLLVLDWNGEKINLSPGVGNSKLITSGVSAPLKLEAMPSGNEYKFSITFSLRGSQGIYFMPLGKETNVHLAGNWASPSFQGAFFPTHNITENNFTADWKVIYLNRNYPQEFSGVPMGFEESRFGMSLFVPVSDYQKNQRSAKYAVLIIALTFMVFFFVQVLNKVRVHGIQFVLVGLALCLFYVLLLSFTEHVGFNIAYLLSCIMTIGLVSLYVKAIFKNNRLSLLNFLFMLLIYLFVFVIIQLEQYSLLVGSIGLFAVLAVAMYLSRNITWGDSLGKGNSE